MYYGCHRPVLLPPSFPPFLFSTWLSSPLHDPFFFFFFFLSYFLLQYPLPTTSSPSFLSFPTPLSPLFLLSNSSVSFHFPCTYLPFSLPVSLPSSPQLTPSPETTQDTRTVNSLLMCSCSYARPAFSEGNRFGLKTPSLVWGYRLRSGS